MKQLSKSDNLAAQNTYAALKILEQEGSDAAHVLCVSENPDFDPFEILIDDILKLYIVKGSISKNTL